MRYFGISVRTSAPGATLLGSGHPGSRTAQKHPRVGSAFRIHKASSLHFEDKDDTFYERTRLGIAETKNEKVECPGFRKCHEIALHETGCNPGCLPAEFFAPYLGPASSTKAVGKHGAHSNTFLKNNLHSTGKSQELCAFHLKSAGTERSM